VCIQGGYKTVTPVQIANCLGAYDRDEISYRSVRVFFACLSLVAIREAAKRVAKSKGRKSSERVCYRTAEIARLTSLPEREVKKALRSLTKAHVLKWSESAIEINYEPIPGSEELLLDISGKRSPKRPVPVPRSVLRFLAQSTKAAIGKTVIAYLMRGLSIDRYAQEIKSCGSVKASWIAGAFGISLRSVKSARNFLILSGFITKDVGSFQRKLNRDGAYFAINLTWTEGERRVTEIAPLTCKTAIKFAPPYKDKKTSYEFKNQKTESRALKLPGVCKANGTEEPKLRDVRPEDVKAFPRLKILFAQAAKAGWLQASEANFLNWVSAAIRANTVAARDPVRVFVSIVKRGKWELITQAQEERARGAIKHYREKEATGPKRFDASEMAISQSSK
jgi:hypothetical protein